MTAVQIRISLEGEDVVIEGDENELYRDVVLPCVSDLQDYLLVSQHIDVHDSSGEMIWSLYVDERATMLEVATALCQDSEDKEPLTLVAAFGGRGGDGPGWFTFLTEVQQSIDQLVQVGGYIGLGLQGFRVAQRRYHRETRRWGKEWIDTGAVPMRLRQEILARRQWARREFDVSFGLGNNGPRLLRELGYAKTMLGTSEYWYEVEPE